MTTERSRAAMAATVVGLAVVAVCALRQDSSGVAVGALVAWFGWAWRPIAENAGFRKAGSLIAVLVLVPIAALSLFLATAIWGNTCDDQDVLCFAGPDVAMVLGIPGVVAIVLVGLLLLGWCLPRRRAGRIAATLALTSLTGLAVAIAGVVLLSIDWAG